MLGALQLAVGMLAGGAAAAHGLGGPFITPPVGALIQTYSTSARIGPTLG